MSVTAPVEHLRFAGAVAASESTVLRITQPLSRQGKKKGVAAFATPKEDSPTEGIVLRQTICIAFFMTFSSSDCTSWRRSGISESVSGWLSNDFHPIETRKT